VVISEQDCTDSLVPAMRLVIEAHESSLPQGRCNPVCHERFTTRQESQCLRLMKIALSKSFATRSVGWFANPNSYRSRLLDIVEAMQKQYRYISNEALQMITDMLPMHAIALGQRRAGRGSRAPEGSICCSGL
jgi:hypothetical protein